MAFDTLSSVIPANVVNSDGVAAFLQSVPRGAPASSVDLAIICGVNPPNALVAPRALAMLLSQLSRPVAQWDPATGAELPPHFAGTLVVSDVETLNDRQQQELLDFLDDRRGGVQIISVAATELFQYVERGEFSETLFYRLNTIRIDADACLNESRSALAALDVLRVQMSELVIEADAVVLETAGNRDRRSQ